MNEVIILHAQFFTIIKGYVLYDFLTKLVKKIIGSYLLSPPSFINKMQYILKDIFINSSSCLILGLPAKVKPVTARALHTLHYLARAS